MGWVRDGLRPQEHINRVMLGVVITYLFVYIYMSFYQPGWVTQNGNQLGATTNSSFSPHLCLNVGISCSTLLFAGFFSRVGKAIDQQVWDCM